MIAFWKRYFGEPKQWAAKCTTNSRNFLNLAWAGLILNAIFPGYLWHLVFSYDFAFSALPADLSSSPDFIRIEGTYKYKYGGKSSWPQVCIADKSTEQYLACAEPRVPTHRLVGQAGKFAYGYVAPRVGLIELVIEGNTAISPQEMQEYKKSQINKALGLLLWTVAMLGIALIRQHQLLSNRKEEPSGVET